MIVFITGPVRSGKSARAAEVAHAFGRPVTYVATARVDPTDAEMQDRIARHRTDRCGQPAIELWQPGAADLPAVVATAAAGTTLLVDSVGTWLAGHLLDLEAETERDPVAALRRIEERTNPLIDHARRAAADIVFVAEETGWGLVPPSALGRIFRDQLGRLGQGLAREAGRVELVVAGYALDLTRYGMPVGAATRP